MSLIVDYPYLFNSDFLLEVDQMHIKTQYVKVTLLSWEEEAIEEIQGKVISGNVNYLFPRQKQIIQMPHL